MRQRQTDKIKIMRYRTRTLADTLVCRTCVHKISAVSRSAAPCLACLLSRALAAEWLASERQQAAVYGKLQATAPQSVARFSYAEWRAKWALADPSAVRSR